MRRYCLGSRERLYLGKYTKTFLKSKEHTISHTQVIGNENIWECFGIFQAWEKMQNSAATALGSSSSSSLAVKHLLRNPHHQSSILRDNHVILGLGFYFCCWSKIVIKNRNCGNQSFLIIISVEKSSMPPRHTSKMGNYKKKLFFQHMRLCFGCHKTCLLKIDKNCFLQPWSDL